MKTYKLAVFDLAGTTVKDNNTVGGCLQIALASVGVHVSVDEVNRVMGMRKPIAIQLLLDEKGATGDVDTIHEYFREIMIETYRTDPELSEIPGAAEVFTELKQRGIRVAVDTGFDRETTDILLSRMPWADLLDDSITSDEVVSGRPSPDMILELCRRAGVLPIETIKVGDTPSDILEGRAAGVGLNVAVTYGTHTVAQLDPHNPDAIISDLRELLSLEL